MTSFGSDSPLDPIERLISSELARTPEADWDAAVEALCAAHPQDAEVIRRRYALIREITAPAAWSGTAADAVPGYRDLRQIGSGGMGIVYAAVQESTGRDVVLKMVRPDLVASASARERFRREVAAVASLDDPGIAAICDAGEVGGVPYLAMRHVPGRPLSEQIGGPHREPKSILEAVELIETLARALHVAHRAGLVHRDVKPANVMVQPDGQPVLLDFGLALAVEDDGARLTMSGEIVGTPAYMAPEQIAGGPVDARCDVYSLGVTLFELLTGRLPFIAPTRDALYRLVLAGRSTSAREHNRAVPRDLSVVLEVAMDRDPRRRYATALDLAEDLRRVRAREPILARPAGPLRRLQRWAQRSPVAATLSASLGAALVLALVMLAETNAALAQSEREAKLGLSAEIQSEQPRDALVMAVEVCEEERAAGELSPRAATRLRAAMAAYHEIARLEPGCDRPLRCRVSRDGRAAWFNGMALGDEGCLPLVGAWIEGAGMTLTELPGRVTGMDLDPDSGSLVVGCFPGGLFELVDREAEPRPLGVADMDGAQVAFVRPGCVFVGADAGRLGLVDVEAGEFRSLSSGLQVRVRSVAASPDGHWVAAADLNGSVCAINLTDGDVRGWTVPDVGLDIGLLQVTNSGFVRAQCIETSAAVALGTGGEILARVVGERGDLVVRSLILPDAPVLVTAHKAAHIELRDLVTGTVTRLSGHDGWVFEVAVSDDGELLASGAGDGRILVWDLETLRPVEVFELESRPAFLRFSPDGARLVAGSNTGRVRVYSIRGQGSHSLRGHSFAVRKLAHVRPERSGAVLFSADAGGGLAAWGGDGRRLARVRATGSYCSFLVAAPDGSRVATLGHTDRTLRLYDGRLRQLSELSVAEWNRDLRDSPPATWIDGGVLTCGPFPTAAWRRFIVDEGDRLVAVDPPDGLPPVAQTWGMATSRDGRHLLLTGGNGDRFVRLYSWQRDRVVLQRSFDYVSDTSGSIDACAFSPDGRWIVVGARDCGVQCWHVDSGRTAGRLSGHTYPIEGIDWAPDGQRFVSVARDRACLWRRDGTTESSIQPSRGAFVEVRPLPDDRIAIACTTGEVRFEPASIEGVVTAAQRAIERADETVLDPYRHMLRRRR